MSNRFRTIDGRDARFMETKPAFPDSRKWEAIDATLLPFPFCGAKAYCTPSGSAGAVVQCSECSARTISDVGFGTAVEHWNVRESHKA